MGDPNRPEDLEGSESEDSSDEKSIMPDISLDFGQSDETKQSDVANESHAPNAPIVSGASALMGI